MERKTSVFAFLLRAAAGAWAGLGIHAHSAKPFLVKDINPIIYPSPIVFTVVRDKLYFNANDGFHSQHFWPSDGTKKGTFMMNGIRAAHRKQRGCIRKVESA